MGRQIAVSGADSAAGALDQRGAQPHALMGATRRGPAMEYVGIDLHKKESQICLLTETGEVMERRIRAEPQRLAEVFAGRPRGPDPRRGVDRE